MNSFIDLVESDVACFSSPRSSGRVTALKGPLLFASLPLVQTGELCSISRKGLPPLLAQVVAFEGSVVSLSPFDDPIGITPGAVIRGTGLPPSLREGDIKLGTVIDAVGKNLSPSDPKISSISASRPIHCSPPRALTRPPIAKQLSTGVRAIDLFVPLGEGQRVGLFAGAGGGKSTLLGMIARNTTAEVIVIGLVGERGREVNEFLKDSLGHEGLSRSVVVVATSDETPLRRALAPFTATSIAEYFRDSGKKVLLLIDSLTRTARAVRDVSLSGGELPIRQGYTPRVYTELPKLLERAGPTSKGSITALYTILTNDEDEMDPLAEEVKSLLDGHIILSRQVAHAGIYPAIDIPRSLSRLQDRVQSEEVRFAAETLRRAITRLQKDRDIVMFGGTPDEALACALAHESELRSLQRQKVNETVSVEESTTQLLALAEKLKEPPVPQ